jgi:hypothetical protein
VQVLRRIMSNLKYVIIGVDIRIMPQNILAK